MTSYKSISLQIIHRITACNVDTTRLHSRRGRRSRTVQSAVERAPRAAASSASSYPSMWSRATSMSATSRLPGSYCPLSCSCCAASPWQHHHQCNTTMSKVYNNDNHLTALYILDDPGEPAPELSQSLQQRQPLNSPLYTGRPRWASTRTLTKSTTTTTI